VDPESNAGESFGRRVFSILDTEAISGEEQGKVICWSGISRRTVDLIWPHPEQETGSSFFFCGEEEGE